MITNSFNWFSKSYFTSYLTRAVCLLIGWAKRNYFTLIAQSGPDCKPFFNCIVKGMGFLPLFGTVGGLRRILRYTNRTVRQDGHQWKAREFLVLAGEKHALTSPSSQNDGNENVEAAATRIYVKYALTSGRLYLVKVDKRFRRFAWNGYNACVSRPHRVFISPLTRRARTTRSFFFSSRICRLFSFILPPFASQSASFAAFLQPLLMCL